MDIAFLQYIILLRYASWNWQGVGFLLLHGCFIVLAERNQSSLQFIVSPSRGNAKTVLTVMLAVTAAFMSSAVASLLQSISFAITLKHR